MANSNSNTLPTQHSTWTAPTVRVSAMEDATMDLIMQNFDGLMGMAS